MSDTPQLIKEYQKRHNLEPHSDQKTSRFLALFMAVSVLLTILAICYCKSQNEYYEEKHATINYQTQY